MKHPAMILYGGEMLPLREACKAAGVIYNSVRQRRFYKKVSLQEAFDYYRSDQKKKAHNTHKVIYNGTQTLLVDACKDAGLNYSSIINRLRKIEWGDVPFQTRLQTCFDHYLSRKTTIKIDYAKIDACLSL